MFSEVQLSSIPDAALARLWIDRPGKRARSTQSSQLLVYLETGKKMLFVPIQFNQI